MESRDECNAWIIKSPAKRTNCFISTNRNMHVPKIYPSSPQLLLIDGFVFLNFLNEQRGEDGCWKTWKIKEFLPLQLLGKNQECPGTAKHCMAPGRAFIPELRMAFLGLVWRREPIVAELVLLLLVVPSPLQVSCRVESCPGMVMDLAVEGGL